MKRLLSSSLLFLPLGLLAQPGGISVWLTNPDRSALFALQPSPLTFSRASQSLPTINITEEQTFQSVVGFGFALTGGSAQLLSRMSETSRAAILKELFADGGKNIGISYLRVSIGASDMNDRVFSYDDVASGQTDVSLSRFTLAHDEADVIPVLKQVLSINPKIRILGSPWSAPAWMKTNSDVKGGQLKKEYYPVYAQYFVRYIQGMKAHGITIDAITIQNEPLNPKNTPSMVLEAPAEADFIKSNLGPAFKRANIKTKIWVYDHNCDIPEYALSILRDPEASQYVDGSAFHLYEGKIEAMSQVHDAFPNKNLYFTEFMAEDLEHPDRVELAPHVHGTAIGALRNWSRTVLLWNLAADPHYGPHTGNGGCPICQGAITIDGDNVTRNLAYYVIAHFSKFVRPGSIRIGSTAPETLPNVAFKTPEGKKVLVVVANDTGTSQTFAITDRDYAATAKLNAGSVGTYIW